MRRILLSLLLAWVTLAPVLANACAVRCEMHPQTMQQEHQDAAAEVGMDCHGSDASQDGGESPDQPDGMMAAGCLLAATASVTSPVLAVWNDERASEHPTSLSLLPPSVSSAPPDKPPRA